VAVQTIEGFDGDLLMQELRAAFSREHALQCGFCTSGMLIAARDIVQRLPCADERVIRVELSGNLCRCTGYLGIVKAVRSVIEARGSTPAAVDAAPAAPAPRFGTFVPTAVETAGAPAGAPSAAGPEESRKGWTRFEESFVIVKPPATVWEVFSDIPAVAACLTGAELTDHDGQTARGRMTVKLGPILAAFSGSAVIERDDRALRGVIRGAGSDKGTGSRTKGDIIYHLAAEGEGQQTRVFLTVEYNLQGALAQFSRSSLAQELGRRLVADFAANLNARLAGSDIAAEGSAAPLNVGRLMWSWLRDRLRRAFGR
jgi:carbon-monoxide dehydrogenase small subunit